MHSTGMSPRAPKGHLMIIFQGSICGMMVSCFRHEELASLFHCRWLDHFTTTDDLALEAGGG